MKKLITIAFAAIMTMFGLAAPAHAQNDPTVEECAEQDDSVTNEACAIVEALNIAPDDDGVYPLPTEPAPTVTLPDQGTAPAPTTPPTVPPQGLPATGSGVNGVLQIGGLLLLGGLVVFVAARRRGPATAS